MSALCQIYFGGVFFGLRSRRDPFRRQAREEANGERNEAPMVECAENGASLQEVVNGSNFVDVKTGASQVDVELADERIVLDRAEEM